MSKDSRTFEFRDPVGWDDCVEIWLPPVGNPEGELICILNKSYLPGFVADINDYLGREKDTNNVELISELISKHTRIQSDGEYYLDARNLAEDMVGILKCHQEIISIKTPDNQDNAYCYMRGKYVQ